MRLLRPERGPIPLFLRVQPDLELRMVFRSNVLTPPRETAPLLSPVDIDGRRKRAESNRNRIAAAFLALVSEGVVTPTADDVATRAGVGVRSVFRHYCDMEKLYRESAAHSQRVARQLSDITLVVVDCDHQLDRLIADRTAIYEEVMPYQIAARVHLHESAYLRLHQDDFIRLQRTSVLESFPKDWLKDRALFEALNLTLSFDTWMRLRGRQRLDVAAARQVLALTCRSLLRSLVTRSDGPTAASQGFTPIPSGL